MLRNTHLLGYAEHAYLISSMSCELFQNEEFGDFLDRSYLFGLSFLRCCWQSYWRGS